MIVWAETGCTARAKPAASDVTTKSRLVKSVFVRKLVRSSCIDRSSDQFRRSRAVLAAVRVAAPAGHLILPRPGSHARKSRPPPAAALLVLEPAAARTGLV